MYSTYICKYDNNVPLKVFNETGIMYNFYKDGGLLLREPKKRQIITNLINKGVIDKNKNFIDGGAFLGDTSLPLCLNTNGLVYSIDPGDTNIDIITNLAELNGIKNIKILKHGLTSKSELLYYNHGDYSINFNNFYKNPGNFECSVQGVSLDELYVTGVIENIDFIHIDVENLEDEVLDGSKFIINRYHPIIIFEGHVKSYLAGVTRCMDILNKQGYVTYIIDEDAGIADDCKNFLSIPSSRHNHFLNECDNLEYLKRYTTDN